MSNLEIIEGLCRCIEELLELVQDSAAAAEIEKEYRDIMGEEDL